jgi:hypothetical protein
MIKLFINYVSSNDNKLLFIYEEFTDFQSAVNFLENFVSYNNVVNVVITRG